MLGGKLSLKENVLRRKSTYNVNLRYKKQKSKMPIDTYQLILTRKLKEFKKSTKCKIP